mmetsp:Transcript_111923/g.194080  ORF Transcript_111923/g.194080 Transcript_111923/m.194080 type:complete len:115 (+) Transcript_111923:1497-1841(+)
MRVASCCSDFEYCILYVEDRYIESATTHIKNEDVALFDFLLLAFCISPIQAICNSSSCRLVDNAQHIEPSNFTRILRGLSLRIVEVRWHSYDSRFHTLAEKCLGRLLHLDEDHG